MQGEEQDKAKSKFHQENKAEKENNIFEVFWSRKVKLSLLFVLASHPAIKSFRKLIM